MQINKQGRGPEGMMAFPPARISPCARQGDSMAERGG